MKKQSDLSRLMGYAGSYRNFTYASWVLSAISALVALVPFVYIWKILRDVLNAAPDYAQAVNIPHYGWMAVLFAVLSYLIYIAALLCSHLSAFRVATNLRLAVSEHLAVLPLGFAETFGQSVFSFKKFKATIDEYEKWVVSYTKELRMPMMFYTAAVNGVFAFLIAGGLLFTAHGVTPEFLLNLLFYIIITPVISLTLTRMMYMSENKMVVADVLARIDSVLETAPMQVQAVPQHPQDASVALQDVHFSYDSRGAGGAESGAVHGYRGKVPGGHPYRHRHQGRVSFRRRAAAHRHCPRHAEKCAHPDPGRSHRQSGCGKRNCHSGGTVPAY